jgi:hypothetical protein
VYQCPNAECDKIFIGYFSHNDYGHSAYIKRARLSRSHSLFPNAFERFRRRSARFTTKRTRPRNLVSLKCAGSATGRRLNS